MIAHGHSPDVVWDYTPRQINGFSFFVAKRVKGELKQHINTQILGSRGDKKAIQAAMKELDK